MENHLTANVFAQHDVGLNVSCMYMCMLSNGCVGNEKAFVKAHY